MLLNVNIQREVQGKPHLIQSMEHQEKYIHHRAVKPLQTIRMNITVNQLYILKYFRLF
jgi:hypothetical protein